MKRALQRTKTAVLDVEGAVEQGLRKTGTAVIHSAEAAAAAAERAAELAHRGKHTSDGGPQEEGEEEEEEEELDEDEAQVWKPQHTRTHTRAHIGNTRLSLRWCDGGRPSQSCR